MIANPKMLVVMGDSYTEYYNIAELLHTGFPTANMKKFGLSGSSLFMRLSSLRQVYDANPSVVVLEFGINDYWRLRNGAPSATIEQFKTDIAFAINEIRYNTGAKIVYCGIPYFPVSNFSSPMESNYAPWRQAIIDITTIMDVVYADWYQAMFDAIAGGVLPADLFIGYDNVHPSPLCQSILVNELYNKMINNGLGAYLTGDTINRAKLRILRV